MPGTGPGARVTCRNVQTQAGKVCCDTTLHFDGYLSIFRDVLLHEVTFRFASKTVLHLVTFRYMSLHIATHSYISLRLKKRHDILLCQYIVTRHHFLLDFDTFRYNLKHAVTYRYKPLHFDTF